MLQPGTKGGLGGGTLGQATTVPGPEAGIGAGTPSLHLTADKLPKPTGLYQTRAELCHPAAYKSCGSLNYKMEFRLEELNAPVQTGE